MDFSELPKGQRLKIARKAAKLTQDELGAAIGVGKSQISNIEQGASELTTSNAVVLSKKLGITTDWLLTGEGKSPLEKEETKNTTATLPGFSNMGNSSNKISVNGGLANENSRNIPDNPEVQFWKERYQELKEENTKLNNRISELLDKLLK